MDYGNLPWRSAAILVWLDAGQEPDVEKHFMLDGDLTPPAHKPEGWWTLEQAVTHAGVAERPNGKAPWIKVGETVLHPDDIQPAYHALQQLQGAYKLAALP